MFLRWDLQLDVGAGKETDTYANTNADSQSCIERDADTTANAVLSNGRPFLITKRKYFRRMRWRTVRVLRAETRLPVGILSLNARGPDRNQVDVLHLVLTKEDS